MKKILIRILLCLYVVSVQSLSASAFVARSESYEITGFGVEEQAASEIKEEAREVAPVQGAEQYSPPVQESVVKKVLPTKSIPTVPVEVPEELHSAPVSIVESNSIPAVITFEINPIIAIQLCCDCDKEEGERKLLVPFLIPWQLLMIWVKQ